MSDENTAAEIARKITVATVVGKVQAPTKDQGTVPLVRVFGYASGIKTGQTQFGPWAGLTGQFEAINLETGAVQGAPVCILPEPMNSLLAERVKAGESVSFALEIGVKHSEKGTMGYEYVTKTIVKETAADPLADLRSQVRALPAPTAAPASGKGKGK